MASWVVSGPPRAWVLAGRFCCERNSLIDSHAGDATFAAYCKHAGVLLLKEMRFWGDIYEMKKDALEAVDRCVEINQCVRGPDNSSRSHFLRFSAN